jgi:hypothetical protein
MPKVYLAYTVSLDPDCRGEPTAKPLCWSFQKEKMKYIDIVSDQKV